MGGGARKKYRSGMKMSWERRGKGMLFLFLGGGGGGMTRVKSLLGGCLLLPLYLFSGGRTPLSHTGLLKFPSEYRRKTLFSRRPSLSLSTTSMAEIKSGRKRKNQKRGRLWPPPPHSISHIYLQHKALALGRKGVSKSLFPSKTLFLDILQKNRWGEKCGAFSWVHFWL